MDNELAIKLQSSHKTPSETKHLPGSEHQPGAKHPPGAEHSLGAKHLPVATGTYVCCFVRKRI